MVTGEDTTKRVIYILVDEAGEIIHMNISMDEYSLIFHGINLLYSKEQVIQCIIDNYHMSYKVEKNSIEFNEQKLLHILLTEESLFNTFDYERYIDIFTGLYSRNFWEKIIRKQIEITCNDSYTVLLIDVDGLKKLNDMHGHLAGDEAIRAIAKALLYVLSKNQYGIRFGGDEFVLILPDVSINEIENLIEKISELSVSFFNNDNYQYELSFSYGYANTKSLNLFGRAFEQADAMMYQEKAKRPH